MIPLDHPNYPYYLKWIHTEFAILNNAHVARRYNPATLLEPKRGRRWKWEPVPGLDTGHVRFLRCGPCPTAIFSELEDPAEEEALLAYAAKYELLVASPPNPFASLRNPGVAKFLLLTSGHHPELWPGRWLPQQLEFTAHAGVN